jgi:hypothetical protein
MSDEISRLLGTTNVKLNTSAGTAVTAPADMNWASKTIVMAAQASETFVGWRRGLSSDATATALQLAGQQTMEFKANPGQTIFYAKALTGTPTLEVEFYG